MATQYAKPYCCVMANMPGHFQGSLYGAKSFNIIRDRLRALGYLVRRVRSRWSPDGRFLKIVIVEFGMSNAHCESAFKLQRMFELRGHGLSAWVSTGNVGPDPYLWVATSRDNLGIPGTPTYTEVPPALQASAYAAAEADIYNPYDSVVAALAKIYP